MSDLLPFPDAQWIQSSHEGESAPYFRKSFSLEGPVKSAVLSITACGLYEAEINGRPVGDAVFTPGWTDYKKRVPYQSYDVTELLKEGENIVGVILGNGWYCGHVAWSGRQLYGDRPRLLATLRVEGADGSVRIVTDSTWKTIIGPILENDFLMGETYDARRELGAWSSPGYDASAWSAVLPAEGFEANPVPQIAPPVRRIETVAVVSSREGKTGRIFDLGQNFSGRVKISARGKTGETMTLRFAEILTTDEELYLDNLRSARATDRYIFKSTGETETWEPRFTFHGFRYVEVSGASAALEVTGVVLHSDMEVTGQFRCSSELLNQLQHNILWGQKSNFLEVPTDCPQRDERLGWTGDAQVFIRTAAFNMDVRTFFHKWIQDARDAQTSIGAIPAVIPNTIFLDGKDGGPAWADATIICPWTIYLCYGDRQILVDHYESMRRYMEFMAQHQSLGHIRVHPDLDIPQGYGDWLALDGSGITEGATPKDLIGTAFYAYDAEILAKVSDLLGRGDEAKRYRALHAEIREAFQRRFVTAEGLIAAGTQTSMVLALHFDLVPPEVRANTAKALVADIQQRNFHLATGFVGTPYLLDVLVRQGYLDVAYKLLEQETFPSWLFPVKNGATTIWERWDGWTPDKGFQTPGMNSFNHYAYGAVGAWMYAVLAGLELDENEPGYRHILFQPRPGGTIRWAEAELNTPHGPASIRWHLKEDGLHVRVVVPERTHATFSAPEGYRSEVGKLEAGTHQFVCRQG